MEKDIVLKVENLNVDFGEARIIEDLSFDLKEKELLVILGPNGAGKSTILKALLGLIPYQGQIQWKDSVHVGYVPNEFGGFRSLKSRRRLSAHRRSFWLSGQWFLQ